MTNPKNLLIVRTDRIGDVVLALPLSHIIKKNYPDCKITFLIREYTKDLVSKHPDIDNLIILKEEGGKIKLRENISAIKEKTFDACIVVYPTFVTALIMYLSLIPVRIGTGYRWYSSLFNRKVYVHRKFGDKHELEFNVDLLKEIGIEAKINRELVQFGLTPDENEIVRVKKILREKNISLSKWTVIIHPGSGGSAVDLPASKFRELIKLINENLNIQILLTGSKNEAELCKNLVVSENVFNLAGEFNLSSLIALINEAQIFIANSTGPIHIAAALDKYIIGFYPNQKACSSVRWGPYSNKAFIFSPEKECEDCKREQCVRSECMSTINMTHVFVKIEKICKLLENNGVVND